MRSVLKFPHSDKPLYLVKMGPVKKMSNFINALNNSNEIAYTENGAPSYASTDDEIIDLLAHGGSMRGQDQRFWEEYLLPALEVDAPRAVRVLAYLYDCRQGAGERDLFYNSFVKLPESTQLKNLHLIPSIGRWDMIVRLMTSNGIVGETAVQLYASQLLADKEAQHPSLAAKWAPREGKADHAQFQLLRRKLNMTPRQYRKTLSCLNKAIQTVEVKMSARAWSEIEYKRVPSVAAKVYRHAFTKRDENRYQEYIQSVLDGKETINTSVLYPYELVKAATHEENNTIEAQWRNLPSIFGELTGSILPVIDVSGSMETSIGGSSVEAIDVALSLGLYLAEQNKGEWGNHFYTFHTDPKWVKVRGKTLHEKITAVKRSNWGGSTNIQRVFRHILTTAQDNSISQEDMPKAVVIISDMEFDNCEGSYTSGYTNIDKIKNQYAQMDYQLPHLIFWNVCARNKQFPAKSSDGNTTLISGFSPNMAKEYIQAICRGEIPNSESIIKEILARYEAWQW